MKAKKKKAKKKKKRTIRIVKMGTGKRYITVSFAKSNPGFILFQVATLGEI